MDVFKELAELCRDRGVKFTRKANNHCQLEGPLLVNYYPLSKKRTVYIDGTTQGRRHKTPEQAVAMCFEEPSKSCKKVKRKPNHTRRRRNTLFCNHGIKKCHWCKTPLTLIPGLPQSATLEHIIPLARGGLDNMNNMTLACEKCNQDRGSDMPELKG